MPDHVFTPKSILITGGAGFIASHVVIHMVNKYPQYNIVNLDKLDYCSSLKNIESISNKPNYRFVHGNICSKDLVMYILESEQIDTIMHFAAESHVDNSFGNSLAFTENNVIGTHVLLECSRIYGKIKRFVHVSTDEVYGEVSLDAAGLAETSVLAPTNPYAATKAAAEFICRAYHKSFGLPVVITRGNNVYGPHQFPEKLIPKFLCLIEDDKPLPLHGGGHTRRNFVHVRDVARAFDLVVHRGSIDAIYNIGSESEHSVLEIARQLLKLYGKLDRESDFLTVVRDRAFNDLRYAVDTSALNDLGWKPEIDWDDGLKETMEWYQKYRSNWDVLVDDYLGAHPEVHQDRK